LRRLVRRCGPLPASAAALIVQQAAEGLEHAHRRGLVHRDIKPGNLLVTPDAVTKLIDLGLAWYLESDIQAAKQGDRLKIVGTADYLAPETIRSPGSIVPISDIYSLGCTLYYAVTGKVPFPGGNPADKMQRHLYEVPLPPDQLQPDLPPGFVELISQMMEKDHHRRVASAALVAQRLRTWASEEAIGQIRHVIEEVAKQQSRELVVEAPRLDDTLTFDDDEQLQRLVSNESPSEQSQGTDPLSSAAADTSRHLPAAPSVGLPQTTKSRPARHGSAALVLAATVTALIALTAMLWRLLT
jgi:eukaryotic-like serine/threonine-protein kinase